MGQTRADTIRQLGKASNQQALVQRLQNKVIKPVRFTIPAGATLTEELDEQGLKNACFTWLRGCREFTQVIVSLAADPGSIKTKETKIEDFELGPIPVWDPKVRNKKWLADKLGRLLFEKEVVAIVVKLDGIYLLEDPTGTFGPQDSRWEPYVEFIPKRRDEYKDW